MKIIGSYMSPYVRKVLACMHLKGLSYEIDPITPFFGNDEFERLSPLRRIPVLIHGDVVLTDSSVICAYLDETHPEPPLLPASPRDRAQARWLEEFADTRLGDLFIWGLFYQRFVRPAVWGEGPDEERVQQNLDVHIPRALDYLETQLPATGFLFGTVGLADLSIATFFPNAFQVGFEVDANRWPKVARFVRETLAHPAFQHLVPYEQIQVSTEIRRRREALLAAGAPLTEETVGQREPRRGFVPL